MIKDIATSGIYGFLVIQIKSCPGDKMQRQFVRKVDLQLCNVGRIGNHILHYIKDQFRQGLYPVGKLHRWVRVKDRRALHHVCFCGNRGIIPNAAAKQKGQRLYKAVRHAV